MGKINSARTVADIEFVIDSGRHPNDASEWHAHEVHCVRNRHRFQGAVYEFIIDVTQLTHVGTPRSAWQAMIVTECWILPGARQTPRQSKWLKVVRGKPSDMLTWMRRHRTQAMTKLT
ncbi:hypothetical protein RA307_29115 [Xanthobacteraceae bacterium Astr-EGSB]|uniref:hypothetical protein n=1 Tax=Astrobacterium formosum TaxID=3069710 RepID=UPI0027B7478D|nr:hypothetical protein [Xanthobacteraceae bacterium Astr-EGSB]